MTEISTFSASILDKADIKPILGYDEPRYMLMVGHEYVPEKGFWIQQSSYSV